MSHSHTASYGMVPFGKYLMILPFIVDISLIDNRYLPVARASARHGILFPFSISTLTLRLRADGYCHSVQARLCRKRCRHVISLGPYLLSMTSSPSALVAVSGFSSFHFRFVPLISAPFAIRRWQPFTQLLFRYWTITVA